MQLLATLVFSLVTVTKQGTRERLAGWSWFAVTTPGSPPKHSVSSLFFLDSCDASNKQQSHSLERSFFSFTAWRSDWLAW